MNRKPTLIVLLLVLLLAACSGEDSQEAAGPELVRQTILANDAFEFDPASMTVNEGANVTISLENEGALEHSWVLVEGTLDPVAATEADAINGATSGNVAGGESTRFSFEAPAAGDYQFVCTVAGHAAAGMVGPFTVE